MAGGSVKVSSGMKMASLADLARELREQGDDAFRRRYPCPFLVVIFAPPADIGWSDGETTKKTRTSGEDSGHEERIKPTKQAIPMLAAERDQASPGITIGRSKHSDVILRSSRISKSHATFTPDRKGRCLLMDTSSSNGTIVNGTPLEKDRYYELNSGDMVAMWRYLFQFIELDSLLVLLQS
jgi:hypothetical protein